MMDNEVAVKCELAEWKDYTIRDIGTVVTGNTPPKKDPENYGGSLVWIKPPDLDKKMFVSSSEETISEIGKNKVRLLPKGSVLVSCIGNIGKIAIADCELCTNQQINSIIPNKDIVDSVFLYYAIKRMKFYLEKIASSAVVPLLNKNDFSKIKIKIPPLKTQKKIVNILERAGKLKEWRAEADGLTEDYLNSLFFEMFDNPVKNPKNWEKQKIKSFVINVSAGWSAKGEDRTKKDGELGVLKISAVTWGLFQPNEHKAVKKNNITKSLIHPMKGDILFSRANTRELVAAVCMVNEDREDLFLPDKLWKIEINNEIVNPYYFLFVLRNESFRNELRKKSTGTSGSMLNISKKKLIETDFPIPPIKLQNEFADIVKQVETLKSYQSQSKQEIDNLFNTLMQKAFKGELVC